jgi:hypothetical protein
MRTRLWSTLLSKHIELRRIRAKDELKRLFLGRQRCSPAYGPGYAIRLKELQEKSASERTNE